MFRYGLRSMKPADNLTDAVARQAIDGVEIACTHRTVPNDGPEPEPVLAKIRTAVSTEILTVKRSDSGVVSPSRLCNRRKTHRVVGKSVELKAAGMSEKHKS